MKWLDDATHAVTVPPRHCTLHAALSMQFHSPVALSTQLLDRTFNASEIICLGKNRIVPHQGKRDVVVLFDHWRHEQPAPQRHKKALQNAISTLCAGSTLQAYRSQNSTKLAPNGIAKLFHVLLTNSHSQFAPVHSSPIALTQRNLKDLIEEIFHCSEFHNSHTLSWY